LGLPVCTLSGNQLEVALSATQTGAAVVTWSDSRPAPTSTDIYAQKITSAGVSWSTDGIIVCDASGVQSIPTVCSDGGTGCIVTWTDQRSGTNEVYAQAVSVLGTVQWTPRGSRVSSAAGAARLVSDNAGGALFAWAINRSTGTFTDVYAQRMIASGIVGTGWPADGIVISAAVDNQLSPTLLSVGASRAIVVWQDRRGGVDDDLYAQCITDEFASDTPVSVSTITPPSRLRIRFTYPNPSRNSVTLEIAQDPQLPAPTVEIFDVTGRLIRTFHPNLHAADGRCSLRWNGMNAAGDRVVSGIYLVRAHSGDETDNQKIVVIR